MIHDESLGRQVHRYWGSVKCYIDDAVINTATRGRHVHRLRKVLHLFEKRRIEIENPLMKNIRGIIKHLVGRAVDETGVDGWLIQASRMDWRSKLRFEMLKKSLLQTFQSYLRKEKNF